MNMKTKTINVILIVFLFLFIFMMPPQVHCRDLKIASFDFNPFIFSDSENETLGLNAELLNHIAKDMDWNIQYVHGSWNEGLERARDREIDILTSVMYTEELASFLDYSKESVITVWGEVFTKSDSLLMNLMDLKKSTVAIMKGDLSAKNFRNLALSFDLNCTYIEVDSLHEVFLLVQEGKAAAGIAPNIFGLMNAKTYKLASNNIMFSPNPLYFAAPKGTNGDILEILDQYLKTWKDQDNSYYHQVLNRWLYNNSLTIPSWVYFCFSFIFLMLLLSIYLNKVLNHLVAKKTEEIKKNEQKFKAFFEDSVSGLIVFDNNHIIREVNKTTERLTKKTKFELLGSDIKDLFDPIDFEKLLDLSKNSEQRNSYFESQISLERNLIQDVEIGLHEIDFENRQLYLIELQDISERKVAEEKIREHVEILDKIAASAKDGIVQIDSNGNISFWNQSAQRIFGYTSEEAIGKNVHYLLAPENMVNAIDNAFKQFVVTGQGNAIGNTLELIALNKQNQQIPVELSLSTFIHDNETHALAIIRDITQRKEADNQRQEMELQLRQKYKMEAVGVMAGGIAHNFNNNLAIMLGNLELALKNKNDQLIWQKYLHNALIAIRRSRDLTGKILSYSRKETGDKKFIRPSLLIEESLQMLRAMIPTTINISFVQHTTGQELIHVDESKLQEALINLCTNAIHSITDKGAITFSIRSVNLSQQDLAPTFDCTPGEFICISVTDSGTGMTTETMDRIFDPFFTTKGIGVGTGMGLATVLGFVRSCSGIIKVHSQLGHGSTFELYFPLCQKENITTDVASEKIETLFGTEHLLIIDDEQMLVQLTSEILTDAGYQVTVKTNSLDAFQLFKSDPDQFDLIITDQTMPGMTGIELIGEIKKIRPTIPTLLLTGYNSESCLKNVNITVVDALCTKPIEMNELLAALRKLLNKNQH